MSSPKTYRRVLRRTYKKSRKRVIRYGLLTANIAILVLVIGFVVESPSSGESVTQNSVVNNSSTAPSSPLDTVSSADIAVHAARLVNLFEAPSVTEQADSVNAQLSFAPADEQVIAKPQVVATALKSKEDIQTYVVQAGESVGAIAAKFGVTSESIRWSNGLSSNTILGGKTLVIPPVNGIVHTVVAGDTPDSLARKFSANKDAIIAFNDAEVNGLVIGERIIIPEGRLATATPTFNFYGGGNYAYGFCTYYAASRAHNPGNWGNANTWDDAARASGWIVSSRPVAGAIAQTDGGWAGHVGIVEEVSADGSQMRYSDMNGLAGWSRVGYSDWVSVSNFPRYIYR